MLDQLVESRNNSKENKKRGEYLLTTFMLVAGLLSSAVVYSLFAKDLGIGGGEFELSRLVAPIAVAENTPPEPLPKEPARQQTAQTKVVAATRQTNTMRIDESLIAPEKISVAPNTQKSRPNGFFLVRDGIEIESRNSSAVNANGRETGNSVGISNNQSAQIEIARETIPLPPSLPPAVKKPIVESKEKPKTTVSGGVINGQATSLPKPIYPAAAKAVNAFGSVNVQVMIDETGKITSVRALDGHFLLRAAAEKAAWSAKFNPTLLSGQPVKVTGVIIYKFARQ